MTTLVPHPAGSVTDTTQHSTTAQAWEDALSTAKALNVAVFSTTAPTDPHGANGRRCRDGLVRVHPDRYSGASGALVLAHAFYAAGFTIQWDGNPNVDPCVTLDSALVSAEDQWPPASRNSRA